MGIISSIQAIATVLMMAMGGWLESFGLALTVIGGGLLLILAWAMFMVRFRHKKVIPIPVEL